MKVPKFFVYPLLPILQALAAPASSPNDLNTSNRLVPRQNSLSPFYPITVTNLALVQAAAESLTTDIKRNLYGVPTECGLLSVLSKAEGDGSICPARDQRVYNYMLGALILFSERIPVLRAGVTATPPSGSVRITYTKFNAAYMKLGNALSVTLREIQKQACLIIADTDSLMFDAFYNGELFPEGSNLSTLYQSFIVTQASLLQVGPSAFDKTGREITEDIFAYLHETVDFFENLKSVSSTAGLTGVLQKCVGLATELVLGGGGGTIGGLIGGGSGGVGTPP
ncbi:hypothetical protein ABW19_dt0210009 [Dactylella cylindrospora]|nr:hypothetical protein ABW19_dt0210009 [Dactylella cylindrospora]